mmetsp:Transcript_28844/g.72974  ORF Transcript_28844/g.72974 Transcript_28844/m.72974 type:complete len:251 (+) Transcript_28844:116-868(+)
MVDMDFFIAAGVAAFFIDAIDFLTAFIFAGAGGAAAFFAFITAAEALFIALSIFFETDFDFMDLDIFFDTEEIETPTTFAAAVRIFDAMAIFFMLIFDDADAADEDAEDAEDEDADDVAAVFFFVLAFIAFMLTAIAFMLTFIAIFAGFFTAIFFIALTFFIDFFIDAFIGFGLAAFFFMAAAIFFDIFIDAIEVLDDAPPAPLPLAPLIFNIFIFNPIAASSARSGSLPLISASSGSGRFSSASSGNFR